MKRILILFCGLALALFLAACSANGSQQPVDSSAPSSPVGTKSSELADLPVTSAPIETESSEQSETGRQIRMITADGKEIVFQLNDSPAANAFYQQLPLAPSVEDYAGSEKVFYPPEELDTSGTPMAQGPAGTLAYYAPWGNVAAFYGECAGVSGLYGLGEAVSGAEFIAGMTGEIQIEAASAPSSLEMTEPERAPAQVQPPVSSFAEPPAPREPAGGSRQEGDTAMKMHVQVGNQAFTATLEQSEAARAFVELMENAPVAIGMRDYSGFEKVGSLGTSLPADDRQITTGPGDIVLYNGNQIVVFYGSNSWSYTMLGRIDDLAGWEEALGNGGVTITFSIP